MNTVAHLLLKYVYVLFLIGSGAKHLHTVYFGEPSVMASGYPEVEAQKFVSAVLATGFLLPFICVSKILAGLVMVIPGREALGVIMAFLRSGDVGLGVAMVPSHLAIMVAIFVVNAMLVYANWDHYSPLLRAK